jgi:hypothetical protein
LGGLTKASDRYARWFGTRVPLVSRGGMVLLTLLAALPFSVVIYSVFNITILGPNWLTALFLTLDAGLLVHALILLSLRVRFNSPSTNSEFNSLVSQIHQKVVIPSRARVWARQSEDAFIASSFNPLFDAIMVSEPMVDLILRTPTSGEALLAFHLMRVPRTKWMADLFGSIILFLIVTYSSSLILVPLAITVIDMILAGYFYIIISALSSFAALFMAPIVLVFLLKGTFWKHEPAFDGVQEIYGIHPNVAKVHIERGYPLTEEEARTVIWGVRDWEKRKRGGRRVGVTTLIVIPSWALGFLIVMWIGYIPYSPYTILIAYLPYIIAATAGLISYLLIRRWDKIAMGEVFKKTTDYDEPLWID